MSDPNSVTEHPNASTADEELFNTDLDAEAELEELQRAVQNAQEDMKLQKLHNAAAKDEGQRKQVLPAGQTASAGGNAAVSATGTSGGVAGSPAGAAAANRNTSVFVGGMDPRTSDADIRLFLSSCGTIKRITILKDKMTGQPKGTAYVEFETEQQATAAVLRDGQPLHSKPLKIAIKRDNIPASQRGGGYGGFRGGGGGYGMMRGGRGGPGYAPQQMMANAMMMMMGANMPFTPYAGGGGAPRGRGRGRGAGRGGQ